MGKIIGLALIVGIVYFAVTQGLPLIQGEGGGGYSESAGSGEEGRCVDLAVRANDQFGNGFARFATPPYDTGAWMSFAGQVQSSISAARDACGCLHQACDLASEAMSELDSLVYEMDGYVRGSAESTGNPARAQERVFDLLDEARGAL